MASADGKTSGAATIVPGAADLGPGWRALPLPKRVGTAGPQKDCTGEEGGCRALLLAYV